MVKRLDANLVFAQCINNDSMRYSYGSDVGARIAVIFAFLCVLPIAVSALGTVLMWWSDRPLTPVAVVDLPTPPHEEEQPQVDVNQLARRVTQLENKANARPFSPSETVARWSTVSRDLTLSHDASEKPL